MWRNRRDRTTLRTRVKSGAEHGLRVTSNGDKLDLKFRRLYNHE